MGKGGVVIRVFGAETQRLRGVTLTLLRPEKELEVEAKDFYELVADMRERYRNTPNKVIVVAETGRAPGEAERTATISTLEHSFLLFPEPARLKAIYIARGMDSGIKRELSGLERIEFREPVYVYQGSIDFEEDVELVILETERGVKVISRHMLKR